MKNPIYYSLDDPQLLCRFVQKLEDSRLGGSHPTLMSPASIYTDFAPPFTVCVNEYDVSYYPGPPSSLESSPVSSIGSSDCVFDRILDAFYRTRSKVVAVRPGSSLSVLYGGAVSSKSVLVAVVSDWLIHVDTGSELIVDSAERV